VQALGGLDAGHKGFALALWIEAMTSGLAGYGRAQPATGRTGASVLVQILDPAAFGGLDNFTTEASFLAGASRASPPADPARPVRVPGDAALARKAHYLREGLELHPEIPAQLQRIAERYGVAMPAPLAA
jgi:L-lactate dehydrogenase